ncbi:MAG: DUF2252 domain-containing protein [Actinomycetota bacterium]|nr:DUF2252 domain-containing protein [Actinomycetota bacterium]
MDSEQSPATSDDRGRESRKRTPRSSHAGWEPAPTRDPLTILERQAKPRVQELLPIRYGRMSASPFAFFRGAAAVMAADLATTPTSRIRVQACGDAHISNFGGFASPDRRLVFDLNDFDETLPAPWEWDVKRMAASAEIAARERGADRERASSLVQAGVRMYRQTIRRAAESSFIDVWYSRLDIESLLTRLNSERHESGDQLERVARKATRKDSARALRKLTETVDGKVRFVSRPPLITPAEELVDDAGAEYWAEMVRGLIDQYAETLSDDRRHLFRHFEFVHMARKVVGVGSVGTRAWVLLFTSGRRKDPLVLQVKEATASVLAPWAGASQYELQGRRVVEGQRLTQAASDLFLGWFRNDRVDGVTRDFYVRQLWDWKLSADIEDLTDQGFEDYLGACGAALALAHARSGDRVAIASYLGKGDNFERAIADFSRDYADLNERDHELLLKAIKSGRLPALTGV